MTKFGEEIKARDGQTFGYDVSRPMQAIKAFCRGCQGGERGSAKYCTTTYCPLYAFRTGRRENGGKEDENAAEE